MCFLMLLTVEIYKFSSFPPVLLHTSSLIQFIFTGLCSGLLLRGALVAGKAVGDHRSGGLDS